LEFTTSTLPRTRKKMKIWPKVKTAMKKKVWMRNTTQQRPEELP
jgi:hypothetical protein